MVKTVSSNQEGTGSIPGQGDKIPDTLQSENQKYETEAIL